MKDLLLCRRSINKKLRLCKNNCSPTLHLKLKRPWWLDRAMTA